MQTAATVPQIETTITDWAKLRPEVTPTLLDQMVQRIPGANAWRGAKALARTRCCNLSCPVYCLWIWDERWGSP